jgi:hypothetical protein
VTVQHIELQSKIKLIKITALSKIQQKIQLSEKKFLHFFFSRLRINSTDRYFPAFPYISPCGRERNFVRCDDQPFVYTHVLGSAEKGQVLSYGYAGDLLTVPFQPECIYVHPDSGRVYHPAPEKVGGVGLVRSQLAIEFSQHFVFEEGRPVGFEWEGREHRLRADWVPEQAQFYSGGLGD